MDLKKKFGIAELKTEYAYNKHLEPQLKAEQMDVDAMGCKLYRMCLGYSTWLNETKLTPELVEKLFKGVIVLESKNPTTKHAFLINETIMLEFSMIYGGGTTITAFVVDSGKEETIQTLADLARLTAAKPIPLA